MIWGYEFTLFWLWVEKRQEFSKHLNLNKKQFLFTLLHFDWWRTYTPMKMTHNDLEIVLKHACIFNRNFEFRSTKTIVVYLWWPLFRISSSICADLCFEFLVCVIFRKTFITISIYHNFFGSKQLHNTERILIVATCPTIHNNYQKRITRPLKMQFHGNCWISQQSKEMIKSEQRWGTIEEPRTANMWNHNSWGVVWFTRHPHLGLMLALHIVAGRLCVGPNAW